MIEVVELVSSDAPPETKKAFALPWDSDRKSLVANGEEKLFTA
jgi:hypothetical protein